MDSLAVGCRFEPAVGGTSEALRVAVLPIREGKCLPGVFAPNGQCWPLRPLREIKDAIFELKRIIDDDFRGRYLERELVARSPEAIQP